MMKKIADIECIALGDSLRRSTHLIYKDMVNHSHSCVPEVGVTAGAIGV
jgi:hypothetical protein